MRNVLALCTFACCLLWMWPISSALAAPAIQEPSGHVYVVQPGDSLARIALEQLGNANAWPQIADATNVKAQGDERFSTVANPRVIFAGQRLWIPLNHDFPLPPPPPPPGNEPELFPLSPDGEFFGYVDATGNYIIEPQYVLAGQFRQERAAVSLDGINFGFIDPTGHMVIPARFRDLGYFADGLAPAMPSAEQYRSHTHETFFTGYIDRAGEWVVQPQFLRVEPFVNGLARALDQEYHFVYLDPSGAIVNRFPAHFKEPTFTDFLVGRGATWSIESLDVKSGICQNTSAYLQHAAVWSCTVEDDFYDPCLLNEDNVSITCGLGGPINRHFVAQTLAEAVVVDEKYSERVYKLWLDEVGESNRRCMRLPDDGIIAFAQDEPSYLCADGAFLVGEPWYVPQRQRWFIYLQQLPELGRDEEIQYLPASIGAMTDLTTSVEPGGGGPGDFIPLGIYYGQ